VEDGDYTFTIATTLQDSVTNMQGHVQVTMHVTILLKLLLRNMNEIK